MALTASTPLLQSNNICIMTFKCLMAIISFNLFCNVLNAQNQEDIDKKFDWGFEGMAGVSVGKNFYAFNVGGPSLLLRLNKDLKIGVGAFPSFYVFNGKTGARLGVSPRIDYKNFVVIVPFYHRDSVDEWIGSLGLGYKFHKKKYDR